MAEAKDIAALFEAMNEDDITEELVIGTCLEHLERQGGRSLGEVQGSLQCTYRGLGGMRCAVGIFIPDALARHIEGLNAPLAVARLEAVGAPVPKVLKKFPSLLFCLQIFHDNFWDVKGGPIREQWEQIKHVVTQQAKITPTFTKAHLL